MEQYNIKRYLTNEVLGGECRIVEINDQMFFPIFKVGSTSLEHVADKVYSNEEISACENVQVLIRDPVDRFVSGINKYCSLHKLDVHETCTMIKEGKVIDRHIAPQFVWLFHLSKFYSGNITLRPFEDIKQVTAVHRGREPSKVIVVPPEELIKTDMRLINLIGQTVDLKSLVKGL